MNDLRLIRRGGCPVCDPNGTGSLCDKHFEEIKRQVLDEKNFHDYWHLRLIPDEKKERRTRGLL